MNSKWIRVILFAVLGIVVFCFIATTSQIITLGELPANFVAVFLEAVVTAVITVVLLTGQSTAEEVKERNVKVFEKKSEIFQEYIKKLWASYTDRDISIQEFRELVEDYYSKIMLYLKKDKVEAMGEYLQTIGKTVDPGADKSKLTSSVIGIINILSKELGLGGEVHETFFRNLQNLVTSLNAETVDIEESTKMKQEGKEYHHKSSIAAKMVYDSSSRKCLVLQGSKAKKDASDSFKKNSSLMELKTRLLEGGELVVKDNELEFTVNALFSSSSAAASIISGTPISGPVTWVDDSNKTLKENGDV